MSKTLAGKVAIVTGAGSGIGRELALALAARGARVGVGVRRIETGEETVSLITASGGEAIPLAMDVSQEAVVESGTAEIARRFGRLDILVHNANDRSTSGVVAADENLTAEKWRDQSRIALGGAFLTARAAYPHMKAAGGGRVFLMSSTFGFHGAAMNTIYASQKSAFRGFIKSLAREWGRDGITVNGICPAAATAPTKIFFDQNPPMRDAYMRKFAVGRMGDPRTDIAEALAVLCMDETSYLTGQVMFLDGGMYPWG